MAETPVTTAVILRVLDQALADLDGPDPLVTRAGIVKRDLALLRFRLRQALPDSEDPGPRTEDSLSRTALLFAALITADSLLSEAAGDVLPPRPGNITYRQHIENWLREAS